MSSIITFESIKSHADNKVVKKDDKGFYYLNLGAVNAFNRAGNFYLKDGVKDLVENQSSYLYKLLKSGYLAGENGHPVYKPGMTMAEFYARNQRIEPTNKSHHIRSLEFVESNIPSGIPGAGNIILIKGWVCPSGPMGDALKKDLDNPDINVSFSIRSFTKDTKVGNIITKKIVQIVTFDWVVAPGIATSNKWDTLSMESLETGFIDIEDIKHLVNTKSSILGNESDGVMEATKDLLIGCRGPECRNKFITDW